MAHLQNDQSARVEIRQEGTATKMIEAENAA
jgi:hypothetical protein